MNVLEINLARAVANNRSEPDAKSDSGHCSDGNSRDLGVFFFSNCHADDCDRQARRGRQMLKLRLSIMAVESCLV